MPIDLTQRQIFANRIEQMKEDGFFLPNTRSMSGDTRYLIVSLGGTGADALFGVKKAFEEQLSAGEIKNRIRFLAIDADAETQRQTKKIIDPDGSERVIQVDALSNGEFYHLSGAAARQVYDKDPHVQEWINPKLVEMIRTNPTLLCGDGCSGIRQLGRLTLYPAPTVIGLRGRITALVNQMTNGNAAPLKVFILSGIAGGTGSGTVVDLSYLIRNAIESLPGSIGGKESPRVSYAGFILLPPTGTSNDATYIARGNRNGYAALKEINHYMTLPERGEVYSLIYGDGSTVTSTSKIYDACYLMDGVRAGVAFRDPRSVVIQVLAECMLDMVSSNHTTDGVTKIQTVDSFMNDQSTQTRGMVSRQSITHAMRDADYIYCALGHSEFAMPMNEIRLYVAKAMFDRIYSVFQQCANVSEQDADEFVKRIIDRGVSSRRAIIASVDQEISEIFRNLTGSKGGPFYAINLLHDATPAIDRVRRRLFKPCRVEQLNEIDEICRTFNNEIFQVYTQVMDAMKDLMADQFKTVVKSGTNGITYSFLPESMGDMKGAQVVISYLNGLINPAALQGLTDNMLQEMVNNRTEWTNLVKSSDVTAGSTAAAAMRRFWNQQLETIVNESMEDFLIKFYSGDPRAHYSEQNDAATRPYLERAAELIYSEMLSNVGGNAQAMAEFTANGLTPENFNGHTYLLVPKTCPHLFEELEKIAALRATVGNTVQVCTSEGSDRITCYRQYTSIPAFKLAWTCKAETDYEKDISSAAGIGTHMSETVGGMMWKNFPNLLPLSSWGEVPTTGHRYGNPREAALAHSAESMFQQAKELKLTTAMRDAAGTPNMVYDVDVLPAQYRPDARLFQDLELCQPGSEQYRARMAAIDASAEELAKALYAMCPNWAEAESVPAGLRAAGVAFEKRKLHFPGSVLTVGPADVAPENWDEIMAACMLRKLPDTMTDLHATELVIGKLTKLVEKATKSKKLVKVFAQYLAVGMFKYNPATYGWEYTDKTGFKQNLAITASPLEESAKYYFLFCAYRNKSDAVDAELKQQFLAVVPDMNDISTRVQREQAYRAACANLLAELEPWKGSPVPVAQYESFAAAMGISTKAICNFYRSLIQELSMGTMGYIPIIKPDVSAPLQQSVDYDLF